MSNVCIQYKRTEQQKWDVVVHGLEPQAITVSTLDSLPFPEPLYPFKEVSLKEGKKSPIDVRKLAQEEVLIQILKDGGMSDGEISAALVRFWAE